MQTNYILSDEVMKQIKLCADETENRAKLNNYNQYRYAPDDVITQNESNFIGLTAEYAAALFFNIEFDFGIIYNVNRPDLVNGLEVRSTQWPQGNLITYDKDKPACYILAIVDLQQSSVDLKGWLDLDECRMPKYFRDKPQVREASYWTPQSDLRPMKELLELVAS